MDAAVARARTVFGAGPGGRRIAAGWRAQAAGAKVGCAFAEGAQPGLHGPEPGRPGGASGGCRDVVAGGGVRVVRPGGKG